MKLTNDTPVKALAGDYNLKIVIIDGTVDLQYDLGLGDGFTSIPNLVGQEPLNVTLPKCNFKFVSTGSDECYMKGINKTGNPGVEDE